MRAAARCRDLLPCCLVCLLFLSGVGSAQAKDEDKKGEISLTGAVGASLGDTPERYKSVPSTDPTTDGLLDPVFGGSSVNLLVRGAYKFTDDLKLNIEVPLSLVAIEEDRIETVLGSVPDDDTRLAILGDASAKLTYTFISAKTEKGPQRAGVYAKGKTGVSDFLAVGDALSAFTLGAWAEKPLDSHRSVRLWGHHRWQDADPKALDPVDSIKEFGIRAFDRPLDDHPGRDLWSAEATLYDARATDLAISVGHEWHRKVKIKQKDEATGNTTEKDGDKLIGGATLSVLGLLGGDMQVTLGYEHPLVSWRF